MAFQAASLPAGVGVNAFDIGRSVGLWVSAFEILTHLGKGEAGLKTVNPLLEGIEYQEKN
jgi:hypothetical protein